MESGLCCTLDPAGGNEVNFRAVLRAAELKWRQPAAADVADEAEADGSDSDDAPAPQPTRGRNADDYDYDDDFIDDEELFQHDTNDAPAPVADDMPLLFDPHAIVRFDRPLPIVRPCDSSFYVNRGDIRPRKKIDALVRKVRARTQAVAAATTGAAAYPGVPSMDEAEGASPAGKKLSAAAGKKPSAAAGASKSKKVTFSKESIVTTSNATEAKAPAKAANRKKAKRAPSGDSKSPKRPLKQQKITAVAKLATSPTPTGPVSAASAVAALAGKSGAKMPKAESTKAKSAQAKPLPPAVVEEVEKLRALCATVFGEKKPNLLDGQVQAQLRTLLSIAAKHKLAKLHPDAQRDNRCYKLADELWSTLSTLLRTTRPYTEQLGHVLHWKAIEEEQTTVVEAAERAMGDALDANAQANDTLQMDPFEPKVLAALRHLLACRTKLNEAQNQLAARTKSVRKGIPSWAAALKKATFAESAVSESTLCAALRKVDEINANEAKRKREEEKEAKKKKRDEKEAAPKQGLPPALRNLASLKAKAPPTKGDGAK